MEEKIRIHEHCNSCKNESFDAKHGLICGITQKAPNFFSTCSMIEFKKETLDELAELYWKIEQSKPNKHLVFKLKQSTRKIIGIILIAIGLSMVYLQHKAGILGFVPFGILLIASYFILYNPYKKETEKRKNNFKRIEQIETLLGQYGIIPSHQIEENKGQTVIKVQFSKILENIQKIIQKN